MRPGNVRGGYVRAGWGPRGGGPGEDAASRPRFPPSSPSGAGAPSLQARARVGSHEGRRPGSGAGVTAAAAHVADTSR